MKRNVIVFGIGILVVLGLVIVVFAGGDDPVVQLGPQPTRIVEHVEYVVTVPPAATGFEAVLYLADDNPRYSSFVDVGGVTVEVHPGVIRAVDLTPASDPSEASTVIVRWHEWPWSGGEYGTSWAYVISSGTTLAQRTTLEAIGGVRRRVSRAMRSVGRVP